MEMKTFVRANWDRVAAVVLVVVGLLALLLGWFGISGTGLAAEQNPYLISGGLLGIALIGIGCTVWLSADLQDEWRRLDALEDRLGQLVPDTVPRPSAPVPVAEAVDTVRVDTERDGVDAAGANGKPRRRRAPVRAAR